MPVDITTPAPAAAIDRLTLATDSVRGAEGSGGVCFAPCGCFAEDAE